MVAGQMIDILADHKKDMSINQIIHLQRLKTGELFAVSCEVGAILGNASPNLRNLLRAYAHGIGLAFQITDDVLDAESESSKKTKRMDKSTTKPTFVSAMGLSKAKEQASILCEQAISHLDVFGKRADLLRDVARHIVDRKH
jgi:farnesyl diphosphate synthase